MATIREIATGIADLASRLDGIQAFGFVPDSVQAPAAFVRWTSTDEDSFGLGSMTVKFDLVFVTSRTTEVGQYQLYEFASHTGDQSVWQLVDQNRDLGLTDGTDASVTGARSLGVEEVAAYGYYGAAFEITVTTPT